MAKTSYSRISRKKNRRKLIALGIGIAVIILGLSLLGQVPGSNQVGSPAPEFALTNVLSGTGFALSDFKGRIVIIEFMATWCSHCSEQAAEFEKLRVQYDNQTLILVSVSSDPSHDTESDLLQFAATEGIDWYLARDTANVTSEYGVSSLPTVFVVDRMGKIAATFFGLVTASELSNKIDSLL